MSLLGTWEGKESCEIWNPKKSNVLQLLVSFLGLVLVSEPYYNEAGYEKQIGTQEGEHNSALYNENALLLCVSHAIKSLRSPPKHCEQIIFENFKQKGPQIIKRLKQYIETGQIQKDKNKFDENGLFQKPSVGFLITLKKLLPKLEQALKD